MENIEDHDAQHSEEFVGYVEMDDAGRVSDAELERLRSMLLTNLRAAQLRDGYRDEHLEAERRVATNIKDQRTASQMSQETLATALRSLGWDLHQSTIAKIEAGKRPLRLAELFAFADALNVPWMNLLEGGRDIDIFPSDGMVPLDVWEAGLEELLHKREDVMADLVEEIELKARMYAEYDRKILVRIAALGNAAARAQQGAQGADDERIAGMLDRWLEQSAASRKMQERHESEENQERIGRILAEQEEWSTEQGKLISEFLRWRSGQAADPS